MQRKESDNTPSDCGHDGRFIPEDNGIGDLFRQYGEEYIRVYRPSLLEIKLIRSIRVCRSPALGGRVYECKGCGHHKYVYYSCGNSRCPKCQGIKRLQWQDKIGRLLFKTPYVHMVFTMPHQLNGLAKSNPYAIYNCLMRSAWSSLKECCKDPGNLGAIPGAVMVLHTFGSDLKYHIHVHALVSFGGIDKSGKWKWPKRKRKIVPFRQIRSVFRSHFLKRLGILYPDMETRMSYEKLEEILMEKSWCVHAEPPTANTKVIEEYLGRYISRIGLSKNRFHFDQVHNEVTIHFKDYKNADKKTGEAPKAYKTLSPLVAMDQIMQHCLPSYFQKCRYYGLHGSACRDKCRKSIPERIKRNDRSVKTLFQFLSMMLGLEGLSCEECGGLEYYQHPVQPNKEWKNKWINQSIKNKGSPTYLKYWPFRSNCISQKRRPMSKIKIIH